MRSFRDISYYNWKDILEISPPPNSINPAFASFNCICQDIDSGKIYVAGAIRYESDWGSIRKSCNGGNTWEEIDLLKASSNVVASSYKCVACDSTGNIYVGGQESNLSVLRKSTNGSSGSFQTIDSSVNNAIINGIVIDSNDNIYTCGYENIEPESVRVFFVRKSTDGSSGSFSTIDSVDRVSNSENTEGYSIVVDSNDVVYVCGYETVTGEGKNWMLFMFVDMKLLLVRVKIGL